MESTGTQRLMENGLHCWGNTRPASDLTVANDEIAQYGVVCCLKEYSAVKPGVTIVNPPRNDRSVPDYKRTLMRNELAFVKER